MRKELPTFIKNIYIMKIATKISLVTLVFASILTTSCNSCNNKQASEIPVTDGTANYNEAYAEADTLATGDAGTISTAVENSGTSAAKRRSGGATANNKKVQKEDKKSDYSAKDGTDAENHDGDMYTKNNQKSMPTGTSIQ